MEVKTAALRNLRLAKQEKQRNRQSINDVLEKINYNNDPEIDDKTANLFVEALSREEPAGNLLLVKLFSRSIEADNNFRLPLAG